MGLGFGHLLAPLPPARLNPLRDISWLGPDPPPPGHPPTPKPAPNPPGLVTYGTLGQALEVTFQIMVRGVILIKHSSVCRQLLMGPLNFFA